MAEMLKRIYDLAVLKVTLLPPSTVARQPRAGTDTESDDRDHESSTEVQFEYQERAGPEIIVTESFRGFARDFGIPRHLSWKKIFGRGEYQFRLPSEFQHWLRHSVGPRLDRETLWLHLVKPYGYLGLFPWEQILDSIMASPVLRLPDFVVDPPKQTSTVVDVTLCCVTGFADDPLATARLAASVAGAITSGGNRPVRLAVFADSKVAAELTAMQSSTLQGCAIHAFGTAVSPTAALATSSAPSSLPPKARTSIFAEYVVDPVNDYVVRPMNDYFVSPVANFSNTVRDWLRRKLDQDSTSAFRSSDAILRQSADPVTSPFLRWVRKTLGERSMDAVHVIADSTLYFERGALLLDRPDAGSEDPGARLVSVAEMLSFQAQVGAWAVGFSSATDNFSDIALRQFADTLAQQRPGPLLYHDAAIDSECGALRDAYGFLFAERPGVPPNSPGIFMYCEPFRVSDERQPDATFETLSRRHIEAEAKLAEPKELLDVFQRKENVPSWVAAGERFVDAYKQRLSELSKGGGKGSTELDEIRSALTRVQNAIAKAADFSGKGGE